MPIRVNDIRRGQYVDSVALMRMSRQVAAMAGVIECGMMMGTPANQRIMADAGVLDAAGEQATPGDLVIAIAAHDQAAADAGLAAARQLLDARKTSVDAVAAHRPRTIRAAAAAAPEANLVLISVPGAFAAAEARKAIDRGLNVMMFSDNVPIADEVHLKTLARERGVLMMGPDCGTAIIAGTPLGFANVVPRGDIGIIGASGTGIQEVSCLIANNGGGISQAIGTGGRDLSAAVGGMTTLMAIDLLEADTDTRTIVVISKPPSPEVAQVILRRIAAAKKRFAVCFLGTGALAVPANASLSATLSEVAEKALGRALPRTDWTSVGVAVGAHGQGMMVRGLFAGGTLCAEAQVVLRDAGLAVSSNAAIGGVAAADTSGTHLLLDLGDDAYTLGRPHPMIEPAVRTPELVKALGDPTVGVVLVDLVLGLGAHADPAGELVGAVRAFGPTDKTLVASITGTDGDPQDRGGQIRSLRDAGFAVVTTGMADAARLALRTIGRDG